MKRGLAVLLTVLVVAGALAPAVGAEITTDQPAAIPTSDRLETHDGGGSGHSIIYTNSSGGLQAVSPSGQTISLGDTVTGEVGGSADISGDGKLQTVFSDGYTYGNTYYAIDNGGEITTYHSAIHSNPDLGGVADIDDDGLVEAVVWDGVDVGLLDENGGFEPIVGQDPADLGGIGQADGDGANEFAYIRYDNALFVYDRQGNSQFLGNDKTAAAEVGPIADITGDGNGDVVYIDVNNNVKIWSVTPDTVTDTGIDATNISVEAADLDGDGSLEVPIVDSSGNLKYTGANGQATDVGVQASTLGGISDLTGFAQIPPTIDNASASPDTTTVSADPVTLSVPVTDSEFPDGDEVTVEFHANGQQVGTDSLTSNGTASATITAQDGTNDWWVKATDSAGNVAYSANFSFTGDYAAPTVSNPDPADGAKITTRDPTLSAEITDSDFAAGDSLTVNISLDGSQVHSETISANGTVSTSISPAAGGHQWTVTATDQYGLSTSETYTFSTPSTLSIKNESAPETLVAGTNATVTVQFFGERGSVTTQTTTDGTVNLTGLPTDERFVVQADADGYRTRKTVIRSLYNQQTVYLLPNNATASQIIFEISDPTGEFPPGETYLYIERPLTVNNSTTYQTIAGDTFGATARYPVTLAEDTRYRLRVRHDGQERMLGSYTVTTTAVEELRVQRIEPSADDVEQGAVYGGVEDGQLAVRFRDGTPNTTVTYSVTAANGSTVVPETTVTGESFAHLFPVNGSATQSYNVSYEIQRPDGSVTTGSFRAGSVAGVATGFAMDPQLLSLLSWGAILASMGLIVIIDTRLAPAVGTGTASALTIIGTVAIPAPLLGISGAVAVLALFGGSR